MDSSWSSGDYEGAWRNSRIALGLNISSIVAGITVIVVVVVVIVVQVAVVAANVNDQVSSSSFQ